MTEKIGSLRRKDKRGAPTVVERALMIAATLLSLSVLGYLAYHAATLPAVPSLRAEVVEVVPADGEVHVRIRLVNEGGAGVRTATVEVMCDDPAPSVSFDNLPALAQREGVVVCPEGTTQPEVSIADWIPT